jgi:hypothetical protein
VGEAIVPAKSALMIRALADLPTDVMSGARQVAELTAWRTAQAYSIKTATAALDVLEKLPDWSGGFIVCDSLSFDWRTAPFKYYASFQVFFDAELKETWKTWDRLHRLYLDPGDLRSLEDRQKP